MLTRGQVENSSSLIVTYYNFLYPKPSPQANHSLLRNVIKFDKIVRWENVKLTKRPCASRSARLLPGPQGSDADPQELGGHPELHRPLHPSQRQLV